MGYAMFTARKMYLQAKVSDYNAQLMKLEQEKTKITEQISANQAKTNQVDNAQNMMGSLFSFMGSGSSSGGMLGSLFSGLTGSSGGLGGIFNQGIDSLQDAQSNAQTDQLSAKDKELDRQKQRIDTLLKQAQTELQKVEDAESKAIEKSTAKYVA